MIRSLSILLMLVGFGIFLYAQTLLPYSNEQSFREKTSALYEQENRNEAYWQLRTTYLTPKYEFEDYGLVIAIVGLYLLVLIPRNPSDFKTPSKKNSISLIGLLAALLSIVGSIGELMLDGLRDLYPPWADSLGIPLMGLPIICIVFLGWYRISLFAMNDSFQTSVSISELSIKQSHYWSFSLLMVSAGLALMFMVYGNFWMTAATFMWTYFYLCLALGRQRPKNALNNDLILNKNEI